MPIQRYSRQRELIYQAVRDSRAHPTAEMIFNQLRPENPHLSLGTVYRNLDQLSREGFLTRMPFPVERYDACTDPHCHLRCEKCGAVSDLPLPYAPGLDAEAAALQPGTLITRHDLVFYGTCPACREAPESEVS